MYLVIIGDVLVGEGKVRPNRAGRRVSHSRLPAVNLHTVEPSQTSVASWPCYCSLIAHQSSSAVLPLHLSTCSHSGSQAEGLLSEDCGDRRTVLAVVTLLLLAPLVSAT